MSKRIWIVKDKDDNLIKQLMEKHDISKICATILSNRQQVLMGDSITNNSFYDSFLMLDMEKAVERINQAIIKKEKVTVYGDFDADGVSSTSILYLYLKDRGVDVDYYIPDRMEEGYGINETALQTIQSRGTTLIVTVDTGITAVEDINAVEKHGIDVIVTDHHEPKDTIPDCVAVLNPKREGCGYPYKELAGVGVVFKLIQAIDNGENAERIIREYLPFVCLGTIADVAPLLDENRLLVKYGLQLFAKSQNCGIKAMLSSVGYGQKTVTASNIGFVIAPRINASGRLGSAKKSVEMFLCEDQEHAEVIAQELTEENRKRQKLEQEIYAQALKIIERDNLNDQKIIVVASPGWHQGIIGIVSSKITEKYYKPSILITQNDGVWKGSGRSISGFNLFEALSDCSDVIDKFGGHSLAAGLTLKRENLKAFTECINRYADRTMQEEGFTPQIFIDMVIDEDITMESVTQLKKLEPFGMGNPTPVFMMPKARLNMLNTSYDGKHLRMQLIKGETTLDVIGFNMGHMITEFSRGMFVDTVGTLDINEYNGQQKLQMLLKDVRPSES